MKIRGVIEGFYGTPWTQHERLDLIRFCGAHGLNTWVHAPKDDPYHRKLWRERYPDAELEQLAELVKEAQRHDVEFAYSIAPGLDMIYSSDDELATLVAKCEQVQSVGVRTVQLLWDDVEHDLHGPGDEKRYGSSERPSASAQADVSNRFRAAFAQPDALVVCPMGYANTEDTPYRRVFKSELDADVVLYWTGPEVVSFGITREELDVTVARFGHTLLIWDNYPVNDFAPERLFLGPLRGRDARLVDGRCEGLIANAMLQAVPSKLALATIADWTRDARQYDPISSYESALREHGPEVMDALRRLAEPARVSPPRDMTALVEALAVGVDAATGLALLEPFV